MTTIPQAAPHSPPIPRHHSQPVPQPPPIRPWTSRLIITLLAAAALVQSTYHATLAFRAEDTENLEATRVLAAARQLEVGPSGLYGPFGGDNPWVLIQAPLYYRLTALAALPLVHLAGLDPVRACFITGRLLSLFSLIGCLAALAWLARLDPTRPRAGLWAAALVAASPIVATFPITVRPDMLGVTLQLAGLTLVWTTLATKPRTRPTLTLALAFTAFGLGLATKQHYIVGPALATLLLAVAWGRGVFPARPVLIGMSTGGAITLAYLTLEQSLTRGQLLSACFLLPGQLGRLAEGSWTQVALVFRVTTLRSLGLIALTLAALLAAGKRLRLAPLDRALLLYAAAELLLMVRMCHDSSGAWFNYAIPATLALSLFTGRLLEGLFQNPAPLLRMTPLILAALLLLGINVRLAAWGIRFHAQERQAFATLLADPEVAAVPPAERYFADSIQHYNWRAGRAALTHDVWLYRPFETIHAAAPRADWLEPALEHGPVRLLILPARTDPSSPPRWDGLDRPVPDLGYHLLKRSGPFEIWKRPTPSDNP